MKLAATVTGPGNLVAGLAAVGGLAFGIPWEVVAVVASIAVSWGVQLQQLNGFGGRLSSLESKCDRLEGAQHGEAVEAARASADLVARLEAVTDRLERIEKLLDKRTNL
jgi:hypothetical protein